MSHVDDVPAIELIDVSKSFGSRRVFDHVTVRIPDGKVTCVVGPSGVGKTTLLRIVAGLDESWRGQVFVNGRDVTRAPIGGRGMGVLFQDPVLYPHMTVSENIAFPLSLRGVGREAARDDAAKLAEFFAVGGLLNRRPGRLSGGERQRVALARCFASGARVRLLDEPLKVAFEPSLRRELRRKLRELHQASGGCTVIVTHDQEEALEVADCLLVILGEAAPELMESRVAYLDPPSLRVAQFVGGGTVLAASYRVGEPGFFAGGGIFYRASSAEALGRRGAAVWFVRPEGVKLLPGETHVVSGSTFHGAQTALSVTPVKSYGLGVGNGSVPSTLQAIVDTAAAPALGACVDVELDSRYLFAFDISGTRISFPV